MNLCVKPGQKLGLMIRGGCEYGIGLYVTGVDPNSAAENAGLKVSCLLPEKYLLMDETAILRRHRTTSCSTGVGSYLVN